MCALLVSSCFPEDEKAKPDSGATENISHADKETSNLIAGNYMLDWASRVRVVMVQMIVSKELKIEDLRFNSPETLSDLKDPKTGVFHPDGGGMEYFDPPEGYADKGVTPQWTFNGEFEIDGLADESNTLSGHSEIIAFLSGVSKLACERTNAKLGISGIPRLLSNQSELIKKSMIDGDEKYDLPVDHRPLLDQPEFSGKSAGCFELRGGGSYVFYRVLVSR